MTKRRSTKSSKRFTVVFWSLAAFFSVGYLPTTLFGSPVISMSAAACLVIPFGARSATMKKAIFRGLGLGLFAGAGIWSAMNRGGQLPAPFANLALVYIFSTTGLCVVVAAVFCHLARKRRRELEKAWDELD